MSARACSSANSVLLNRSPSRRRNCHTVSCDTFTPRGAVSAFSPCSDKCGVWLSRSAMKARCDCTHNTLTKIIRKRSRHPMLASIPASILNQKTAQTGIPHGSGKIRNALVPRPTSHRAEGRQIPDVSPRQASAAISAWAPSRYQRRSNGQTKMPAPMAPVSLDHKPRFAGTAASCAPWRFRPARDGNLLPAGYGAPPQRLRCDADQAHLVRRPACQRVCARRRR